MGLAMLGVWSIGCGDDVRAKGNDGGAAESGGSRSSGGKGGNGAGGSSGKAGEGGTPGEGGGGMAGGFGGARDAGSTEPDGGEPMVTITSPADMSTIGPDAVSTDHPELQVFFKVAHFALMPAATPVKTCPLGACGHVHINVDGKDCNDVAKAAPYNVQGIASPLDVELSLCKHGVAAAHIVTASLHNTDHSVVENAAGDTIENSVTITVLSGATEGGAPEGGAPKTDAGDGG
jgi:hypothetical protein